jgi:hypothetical protein
MRYPTYKWDKYLCVLIVLAIFVATLNAAEHRPVLYNGDEDWYYFEGPEYISQQYLTNIVDHLAAAGVTIFSNNFYAAGRCWYDTAVGQRFDTDRTYVYCPESGPFTVEHPSGPLEAWRVVTNFRRLLSEGNDPIQVFINASHARGIKFLACLRMNDRHAFNVAHPPSLTQKYPAMAMKRKDGTVIGAMDFQYPEVRDFVFRPMEELATKYDVDGLELDWMRWVRMFSEDVPRDTRIAIMTDYHRRIRKMLDQVGSRKGKHLLLSVRVPATLDECENAGFDVAAYVRDGLTDILSPSDFMFLDPGMPVGQFSQLTRGSKVLLLPSVHPLAGRKAGYPSPENLRAVAHSYYVQGADGISAYNWYAPEINSPDEPTGLEHFPVLQEMGRPDLIARETREYLFNPLWAGTAPTGRQIDWKAVVSRSSPGKREVFSIFIEENLAKVRATLKYKLEGLTAQDTVQLDVNEKSVDSKEYKCSYFQHGKRALEQNVDAGWVTEQPYYMCEIDDAGRLLKNGANEIGITLVRGAPLLDVPIVLFEVRVGIEPERIFGMPHRRGSSFMVRPQWPLAALR